MRKRRTATFTSQRARRDRLCLPSPIWHFYLPLFLIFLFSFFSASSLHHYHLTCAHHLHLRLFHALCFPYFPHYFVHAALQLHAQAQDAPRASTTTHPGTQEACTHHHIILSHYYIARTRSSVQRAAPKCQRATSLHYCRACPIGK